MAFLLLHNYTDFIGNLLFTTKTGVKVQILQNDKKVDVCVEMQTELW